MKENIKAQIVETITADQAEILAFTQELVAIATENPPGTYYKPCVEVITQKLSEIGLDYEIIEVPNGKTERFPRYCILSSYGTGERTLYFHGHYDVVPASNEEQFQPYVKGGKLFGRGSSDMKSGLTAMIYALKAIKTCNIELNQGSNAFEKMLPVADALSELKQEVESRVTEYAIHPAPARRSILMMGGQCEGGNSFNLVPEKFSFTIDRRINPEEDLEVEKQRLFAVLEHFKKDGIDLYIEILQEGESSGISEDTPLAQALAKNIEVMTGKRPEFEMCLGLLEIRFYAKQGIPAFAYGPGFLSVSHGPHEYVEIENIYRCTAIYALTALDILS